MAQEENGVPNGKHFMDTSLTDMEGDKSLHSLDTVDTTNNHSIEKASCQIKDALPSIHYNEENPASTGDIQVLQGNIEEKSLEENQREAAEEVTQNKLGCTDGKSLDNEDNAIQVSNKTANTRSVAAVSLTDIKACFVNNQELEGDSSANCDHVSTSTTETVNTNSININILQNEAELDSTINSTTDLVSSKTSSDKQDDDSVVIDSKSNGEKVISNYAIQPGELTDQLIEGPSITLPSSEIPNRSSVSTIDCNPPSESYKLDTTSSFVKNENGNSSLQPASGTNSVTDEDPSSLQSTLPASIASSSTTDNQSSTITAPAPAPAKKVKKTPHDFIFGKVIGEGSYSTVYLAKEVSSQREFAVKVCEKKHLIREKKTHFVMREKEVLMKLDHPFFIRLAYTFQDTERLYYVLTYARNGELLSYLNKLSVFDVPCTRFYTAEVVVALEYMQSLGIVHRDLKPENILLGADMHIKITDFGTSKFVNGSQEESKGQQSKRKNSFVGTAEYVSPEVLNGQPANYGTDLWALACIIYQCLSSSLPFRSGNEYQTFQKILKLEYEFPEGFHEDAKNLVQSLLIIEPTERLGMKQPGGMEELKQHPFFQGIDWDNLPNTTPPKLLPYLPATANNPEFWGEQEHRTGFDDQRLAEIITGQSERSISPELEPVSVSVKGENDMENAWKEKLDKQRLENQFHQFVENNLILRQGFVDKRKGLFARKRMLLLTEGPHLYYVDAHNKVLKGEIPWSKELRTEAKNFKIFFVHTPNRTYYLESRNPDAHLWVKRIQEVWNKYYGNEDNVS